MTATPNITLYFLNASRSIRIAYLLEALKLPYTLVSADRAPNGLAPPDFKARIREEAGQPLAKSPTLKDEDVVVTESGAIVEYLLEKYDVEGNLMPLSGQEGQAKNNRAKVREWLYAAEGTLMLHAMAILYTRWKVPEDQANRQDLIRTMEEGLAVNVHNDFDWLESELRAQKGKGWLVSDGLTAADIVMQFSVQFIMERKLGVGGRSEGKWPEVEAWLKRTEGTEAYRRAVERTGYTLDGNFKK